MIKSSLNAILNIFSEDSSNERNNAELFAETVLMTLARVTSVDSNVHPAEVDLVIQIVEDVTGDTVSTADVRVAASSKLYESAPLDRYLASVSPRLSLEQKLTLARALARVIQADERVTTREIMFFNVVSEALRLRASDLVGLTATQPV